MQCDADSRYQTVFRRFSFTDIYSCVHHLNRDVFLLLRNSHQQTACVGLQEPEPVQALQAGAQTGRLRQGECHRDGSPCSRTSCTCLAWCRLTLDLSSLVVRVWADWKRLHLEASLSEPGNPGAQLSRWLQCQMCLPQVRAESASTAAQSFYICWAEAAFDSLVICIFFPQDWQAILSVLFFKCSSGYRLFYLHKFLKNKFNFYILQDYVSVVPSVM